MFKNLAKNKKFAKRSTILSLLEKKSGNVHIYTYLTSIGNHNNHYFECI